MNAWSKLGAKGVGKAMSNDDVKRCPETSFTGDGPAEAPLRSTVDDPVSNTTPARVGEEAGPSGEPLAMWRLVADEVFPAREAVIATARYYVVHVRAIRDLFEDKTSHGCPDVAAFSHAQDELCKAVEALESAERLAHDARQDPVRPNGEGKP